MLRPYIVFSLSCMLFLSCTGSMPIAPSSVKAEPTPIVQKPGLRDEPRAPDPTLTKKAPDAFFAKVNDHTISLQHACMIIMASNMEKDKRKISKKSYYIYLHSLRKRMIADEILAQNADRDIQKIGGAEQLEEAFLSDRKNGWSALIADDPAFSSIDASFQPNAGELKKGCGMTEPMWDQLQKRLWLASKQRQKMAASFATNDKEAKAYYKSLLQSVDVVYLRAHNPEATSENVLQRKKNATNPTAFFEKQRLPENFALDPNSVKSKGSPSYAGHLFLSGRDAFSQTFFEKEAKLPYSMILAALSAKPKVVLGPFPFEKELFWARVDRKRPWNGKVSPAMLENHRLTKAQPLITETLQTQCAALEQENKLQVNRTFVEEHIVSIFKDLVLLSDMPLYSPCEE